MSASSNQQQKLRATTRVAPIPPAAATQRDAAAVRPAFVWLRDEALWPMLSQAAARAEQILAPDPDPDRTRANSDAVD